MTVKVVFIQPNVGFAGHTWESLGMGYLISYLKEYYRKDLDVAFYSGFFDSDEAIADACEDADIIGFTCTSPQFTHGLHLANQVKRKDNLIVFGGVHPSALPDLVLREDCIDVVVQGEGEKSILKIVEDFTKGKQLPKQIYHSNYIEDIDSIPFPDRKTIKNERNIEQTYDENGIRITSVLSSRGCPFHCRFCCSHSTWGRIHRLRSPSSILDEFEYLVREWDIDFIKFADDAFTINKERTINFCKLKLERGIKVPYGGNAHVNTIDEDSLRYLAESNCQELWYGVESGSPRILRSMHKNTSLDRIKKVFELTKQYGIKTRAYFLLGMRSETIEDIRMTEQFCDEIQPDIVGFSLLAPYPGNEYFDYEIMKDWDWSMFDEYNNDWIHTNTLTNQELKQEQKKLIAKYQKSITFRQKQ